MREAGGSGEAGGGARAPARSWLLQTSLGPDPPVASLAEPAEKLLSKAGHGGPRLRALAQNYACPGVAGPPAPSHLLPALWKVLRILPPRGLLHIIQGKCRPPRRGPPQSSHGSCPQPHGTSPHHVSVLILCRTFGHQAGSSGSRRRHRPFLRLCPLHGDQCLALRLGQGGAATWTLCHLSRMGNSWEYGSG